jgi:hypothetical protein
MVQLLQIVRSIFETLDPACRLEDEVFDTAGSGSKGMILKRVANEGGKNINIIPFSHFVVADCP